MPTLQQIEAIFDNLSKGNAPKFFEHVDDNVAWTVKGKSALYAFQCPTY